MHPPQLHLRTLPQRRLALTWSPSHATGSARADLSMEQTRKLVAGLTEPGNRWCENAWLVRRSPDGRSLQLTLCRQVWGIDRTASVVLSAEDARSLAEELSGWLLQVERFPHRSAAAGPLVRLRQFMSLHHI